METKTTLLSKISNTIFLITSLFALIFIWCNFYLKNFSFAILSSIIITIAFCIIYYPINKRKENKKSLTTNNIQNKEFFKTQLLFGNEEIVNNYIINLFDIKNYKTINNSHISLPDKEIYFIFDKEIVSQQELLKILKTSTKIIIDIYCINSDNQLIIPDNFQINLILLDQIIAKSTSNNTKINTNINIKKSNKFSIKSVLCIVLSKSKSRNYFLLSLLLIFSSIFTPYNIYYIICSSILTILAIYARFNTRFN